MNDTIKIYCENTASELHVNPGTSMAQVIAMLAIRNPNPFLAGYVNNRLKELYYKIYSPVSLRFVDITHFEGMRVYQRTLFFVLQKAVSDLFPGQKLYIKHSVAKGFYCEIEGMEDITPDQLRAIDERMRELVAQDIPIIRQRLLSAEAVQLYTKLGMEDKVALLETRPHLYVTLYTMADLSGYFYGALAPTTGYVPLFGLHKYYKGIHLSVPCRTNPSRLENMVPQHKMFDVFSEYTRWVDVLGVATIGVLNTRILEGGGGDLIKIAEAFHEKKLASIADQIAAAHETGGGRIVLISGPSSSGKTTFAKRLGIQLRILGLHPVLVSLDDYFVDREHTPLDEKGEYDYEALEAIDIELFNRHLAQLLDGQEVEIPRYDFITGKRVFAGNRLQVDDRSVLIIEGIHGLNPGLTPHIDNKLKFKIYVSAFTSISMDNMNRIATTDNRLIRRIVRDYRTRGNDATATLRRWESVRRGEDLHIFPNQEQADVMFNSSLFYEIAVLKSFVEPLLHEVPDTMPEYGEARRLLKYLDQFTPLDGSEIPPTSILREFIGGSSFTY